MLSDREESVLFTSTSSSRKVSYVPLFISTALIIGVGVATASTGKLKQQGTASQTQVKPEIAQTQAKPIEKAADPVQGITFADKPGVIYVLARTLSERLNQEIELDPNEQFMTIGDQKFDDFRRLYAGNILVQIRDIKKFGGTVEPTPEEDRFAVSCNGIEFDVIRGKKRIEVDKAAQELTAYQGDIVVLKTNVSTGRPGHNTPNGEFKTSSKERMHYSRKYQNSPMPYAVQVNGDIFFHGYSSVPSYPASHGCIRMQMGKNSPAKYLFSWVNRGIDVKIFGVFDWEARRTKRNGRKH